MNDAHLIGFGIADADFSFVPFHNQLAVGRKQLAVNFYAVKFIFLQSADCLLPSKNWLGDRDSNPDS